MVLFVCLVSSLKVNMTKSKMLLVGVVDNVDNLASIFGYRVVHLTLN